MEKLVAKQKKKIGKYFYFSLLLYSICSFIPVAVFLNIDNNRNSIRIEILSSVDLVGTSTLIVYINKNHMQK